MMTGRRRRRVGHGILVALVAALPSAHVDSAFIAQSTSSLREDTSLHQTSIGTHRLTTESGKPVCRYGLGGAARSVQPASLPLRYRDLLSEHAKVSPFYFYYNPHRYPAFLSGVRDSFGGEERRDVFMASGGTERSPSALDQRLEDALVHCGGDYLDAYVLEYVCPYELTPDNQHLGSEMEEAIAHVIKMKEEGKVRYVVASTHSHLVGAALAAAKTHASSAGETPAFDALMLRYNMSHKNAAETISLPAALERNIPVLAFTSTRWNRLQTDPPTNAQKPSTADCLKFALHHPAVDIVLHSARDETELEEALAPLFSTASSGETSWLSEEERVMWREYGRDEEEWNDVDSFDEYPEESVLG